MQWFRLHDDVLDDPKVQRLSPALFKHWINLLCLASKNTPRGTLPDLTTIAFRLRLTEEKANRMLVELADAGLIDVSEYGEMTPHNWKSRQYGKPSDDPERVAERVKKHRDQQRNADVTPPKREETPLYTDTDTESEQSREETPPTPSEGDEDPLDNDDESIYSPEFEEFWAAYPRKKKKGYAWSVWKKTKARPPLAVLVSAIESQKRSVDWLKDNGDFVPHPSTWLNGRSWDDEVRSPIGPPRSDELPPGVKIDDLLEARARKAKHAWVPDDRLELLARFEDRLPPMTGD